MDHLPEYESAFTWDWRKYGIPPIDSNYLGRTINERDIVQWGDDHENGRLALLYRNIGGLPVPQDPFHKVVLNEDMVVMHDFGTVPQGFRKSRSSDKK